MSINQWKSTQILCPISRQVSDGTSISGFEQSSSCSLSSDESSTSLPTVHVIDSLDLVPEVEATEDVLATLLAFPLPLLTAHCFTPLPTAGLDLDLGSSLSSLSESTFALPGLYWGSLGSDSSQ